MQVLHYPDPRLTFSNVTLGSWSPEISQKVDQMKAILIRSRGVGLAAPQIGWNVRLFILSMPQKDGTKKERVIFDPVMEPIGPTKLMGEGCLSFPMMFVSIPRHEEVRLMGMTPEGPIDETVNGLEAHAVQHEMDPLNGILVIEKMTPADQKQNASILREMEENWCKQHP